MEIGKVFSFVMKGEYFRLEIWINKYHTISISKLLSIRYVNPNIGVKLHQRC